MVHSSCWGLAWCVVVGTAGALQRGGGSVAWQLVNSVEARDLNGRRVGVFKAQPAQSYTQQTTGASRSLVVVLPQLGDFDTMELGEQLACVQQELKAARVELKLVAVGSPAGGRRFCDYLGLEDDALRVVEDSALHDALGCGRGPDWDVPWLLSDAVCGLLLELLPGRSPDMRSQVRPVARAWFNYFAMCFGIASPGTMAEIFRGYRGDTTAPERLAPEDEVIALGGLVHLGPGVGHVKIGPFKYKNKWVQKSGFQRPVELATVRLRNLVEVLSNWNTYVPDSRFLDRRGVTYFFEADGTLLYEFQHTGVLTYSATMNRPLTFLAPLIGAKALNPLELADDGVAFVGLGKRKGVQMRKPTTRVAM